MGLKGSHSIGAINYKHVLFQFMLDENFTRIWLLGDWIFGGCPMRVFKWMPNFYVRVESTVTSIWIRLPELPVYLFQKMPLFATASMVGKPLRVDKPTTDISRPSLARVCIELDLYVGVGQNTVLQQIIYENFPQYYCFCRHMGHEEKGCINKNKGAKIDVESQSGKETSQNTHIEPVIGSNLEKNASIPQSILDGKIDNCVDPIICELLGKTYKEYSKTRYADIYCLFEETEKVDIVVENCNQIKQFGIDDGEEKRLQKFFLEDASNQEKHKRNSSFDDDDAMSSRYNSRGFAKLLFQDLQAFDDKVKMLKDGVALSLGLIWTLQ
ncbi:hypothetical protein Sango_2950500 [Sesamum angolense]|uniref:DUF4283 domain-containing protein n=1 Tax=Sesamum angolense TaxID=2727404 RepID=A0AAE1T5I9_9LAMI|nr:hypothetical protein Sango_2950500 [Sesamum angolense]